MAASENSWLPAGLRKFTIPDKPPSKKNRYKIARGRLYQDKEVAAWINTGAFFLYRKWRKDPLTRPCGLSVVFYSDNRSDTDGMLTSICDVLQKAGIVKNDRLFFEINAKKVLRKPFRTEMTVYEI